MSRHDDLDAGAGRRPDAMSVAPSLPPAASSVAANDETTGRRKFRLLYFVRETFPTHRVDIDVLFGEELLARGHEIDFVMQAGSVDARIGPQEWHGRTVFVGACDTRNDLLHRLRSMWLGLKNELGALRLIAKSRYDAVQVRDKFFLAVIAYAVSRWRGVRFFYWMSFPIPDAQLLRAKEPNTRHKSLVLIRGLVSHWLLYHYLLPRADHVFVQSDRMADDIAAKGVDRTRVTPVPMGIAKSDLSSICDLSTIRRTDADETLNLVYLGTLARNRRLDVLVEMMQLLQRAGVEARLVFVGDGPAREDRQQLESYVCELGVEDRVQFTGLLAREAAWQAVRCADVALSPIFPAPILEPASPTKLVEYMALGIPVVANDHPEQRRVLRASRAGLCVPWGARSFSRAVAWLSRRTVAERKEMGARGRQWVLRHRNYTHIADELEAVYLRLVGSRVEHESK